MGVRVISFFQALMPREEKFFGQFNDHARTLVDGAVALRDLLEGGAGVPEACARIVQHEDKADAIAHERCNLLPLGNRRYLAFDMPADLKAKLESAAGISIGVIKGTEIAKATGDNGGQSMQAQSNKCWKWASVIR